MNKKALLIGKSYTDGKGNVRKLLDRGANYARFVHQQDSDCVQFRVEQKKRGPQMLNGIYASTATAFASWAKQEA